MKAWIVLAAVLGTASCSVSKTGFVDGEQIARLASDSGVYAVHDHENGMICYVAVSKQIIRANSVAISCSPYYQEGR